MGNKHSADRRHSKSHSFRQEITTDGVDDPILLRNRIPLKRLQFTRILSYGGFGEIWHGFHQNKQHPVAIKKLLSSQQQDVQRFIDEIKIMSSLDHPNIVRLIGVAWSTPEDLVMVMEYLAMGDLRTFLEHNNQTLTWDTDKYPIALGVATAILYLHVHRPALMHRDIKAKNIALTEQLQPKLIDFGVSRFRAEETMTAGIGTPYWTAPEVLEGARYTEQADIYSFGIFLSELDTGNTPFQSSIGAQLSAFEVLTHVLAGNLNPKVTANCPIMISEMMVECLRLDPSQRPTAAELVVRLTDVRTSSPGSQFRSSMSPGPSSTSMDLNLEALGEKNVGAQSTYRKEPVQRPLWFIDETRVKVSPKPLRKGGFGSIHYGAFAGVQVIVKRLLEDNVPSERMMKSFVREANVWHKLNHPHVLRFFGACDTSKPPFFVCEIAVTYGNLDDYFCKHDTEKTTIWQLFYQAALGLACLHEKSIVHGDLKCNNILVGNDKTARLADFGLSFIRSDSKK